MGDRPVPPIPYSGLGALTAHEAATDPHPGYQLESEKGSANGYASLDSGGKVPTAQIPATVLGAVDYKGTWNANTNSPDLGSSSPDKGDYYVVATAGSTSLGGVTDWKVGDWAIYNGTAWEKVDNTEPVFGGAGAPGNVPDPGSEDDLFLRDDGTFADPLDGRVGTTAGTVAAGDDWRILNIMMYPP